MMLDNGMFMYYTLQFVGQSGILYRRHYESKLERTAAILNHKSENPWARCALRFRTVSKLPLPVSL
jgi:hypothetical protein